MLTYESEEEYETDSSSLASYQQQERRSKAVVDYKFFRTFETSKEAHEYVTQLNWSYSTL